LFWPLGAASPGGRNWSGKITIKVESTDPGPVRALPIAETPDYLTGILAIYAGTAIVTGEWLAIIGLP